MKALVRPLKSICNIVEKIQIFVGCAALCLFICMTAYQIVSRFTGTASFFTEEISNTAFIWTAFMGSPIMLRRYEHYRFTGVAEKLKGRVFWINEFICLCILLFLSGLMMVEGVHLTKKFLSWGFSSMPHVSRSILWACLPVSGATSLLYVVENLLKFLDDPSTRAIKNIADQLLEEADK